MNQDDEKYDLHQAERDWRKKFSISVRVTNVELFDQVTHPLPLVVNLGEGIEVLNSSCLDQANATK